ncbi:HNH endonuclease signature motif containing protein [Albirhodobacter sp. R86504]|uniref:HNH endonuclease signature motif containing protein n=1 Tax=Albirhodobacter sp. R86504 TaxID=3093848 RepID=UPI00366F6AA0
MKGQRITYSDEELAWINEHAQDIRAVALNAFIAKFQRPDVSLQNFNALCKRNGWLTGRTGRFSKGKEAHNKGKPMAWHPNSAKTRFKAGSIPKNLRPMWSERIGRDGYIEMKVPRENPHTGHPTRFMLKHRYVWEEANGPLPEGMVLKFKDGVRTNCTLENIIAIPRGVLPRLNSRFGRDYDRAPAELKPTIMAVAKLEHAAREAKSKGQDQ